MSKLKTAPKLIIIALVVGGIAFGVNKAYDRGLFSKTSDQAEMATQPVDTAAQTSTAPVANNTAPASFDTLKNILATCTVRVSVENPSAPFYEVDNGQPNGFNVEFAKLLFSQSEFTSGKCSSITVDTDHAVDMYEDVPKQLLKTSSGKPKVDIAMDGLTFPDNTPNGVLYTTKYIDDFGYSLIVQSGSDIESADDLSGKKIGILKGDPDVRKYVSSAFPSAQLVEVDDQDPHFIDKAVDSHQVDAFIYDYPFAVSSIKGTDLKFAVTNLQGSNIGYKIGVRASDQQLMVYLNSAISKVKQSPEYLELLKKYFITNQANVKVASIGEHNYTVKRGDTLGTIAANQLGSSQLYRVLQVRNNIPNPNLITVGQQLVIPKKS